VFAQPPDIAADDRSPVPHLQKGLDCVGLL
jgi:hypothetical protein